MGHHTLVSASEEDRLTAFHTISDMIGSAWLRYKVWDEIDPEELIIGGNFDGTPLWKRTEQDYIDTDDRSLRAMRNRHDCPPVPLQGEHPAVPPAAPLGYRLLHQHGDDAEVGSQPLRRGDAAAERVLR